MFTMHLKHLETDNVIINSIKKTSPGEACEAVDTLLFFNIVEKEGFTI